MNKLNRIGIPLVFEKLMPLCMALFFCRTIFIGYKYLFFLLLVPCVIYSAYWFLKNGIEKPKWTKLLLPLLVIVLFFAHFTPLSNVVKESVNLLLILYFVAFADLYYAGEKTVVLLKWTVRLTILAGVIAIVRFVLIRIGLTVSFASVLFEGNRWALVNDNNFSALFFIIALVLAFRLFVKMQINMVEYVAVFVLSLINVVASVSRRGYVLFVIVVIVISMFSIYGFRDNKKRFIHSISPIIVLLIFGTLGLIYYLRGISTIDMSFVEKCYKLHTLFDKDISIEEFNLKMRMKLSKKHCFEVGDNLFYNGNLKQGLDEWDYIPTPHNCIRIALVEDDNGDNAVRVTNDCASGYWQLHYGGRPIYYHKNVTYDLSFTYRVLSDSANTFNVGWWVYEGNSYKHALPQNNTPIDSVWNRCKVSYTFMQDHPNLDCFLNSFHCSTIEVKDISLTCDDTTGLPMYADQLPDSVIHRFFVKEGADTINYLIHTRTDRWRYALELWQTRYDTKQKIFGQGFKYLKWYGEKFYGNPDRHDFPHNPIISSFLYSGIIGGVVYIIFLIMSLWLYWKKRQQLGIFFIMYLCCMFFSMFSGSSHFSFPLFAFLSFLPFVEYKSDVDAEKVNVTQR